MHAATGKTVIYNWYFFLRKKSKNARTYREKLVEEI
jgi:hypothetical protein